MVTLFSDLLQGNCFIIKMHKRIEDEVHENFMSPFVGCYM